MNKLKTLVKYDQSTAFIFKDDGSNEVSLAVNTYPRNSVAEDRLTSKIIAAVNNADSLAEALETLLNQFDERGYPANTHANVRAAQLDARAALAAYRGAK